MVMDPSHPTSSTLQDQIVEVAIVEAARSTSAQMAMTKSDQVSYLINTIQGIERNMREILKNEKSLQRIVETKCYDLDVKVTELTTTVNQLKHEVDGMPSPSSIFDDGSHPLHTHTQFRTQAISSDVQVTKMRPSSLAPRSAPSTPSAPLISTPPH
ncbi:pumilio-like protein 1 [Hordeum vulgare]|nr:pumilio-like protein 1 [Hordeum vulgare]